jgi:hypothetical protein
MTTDLISRLEAAEGGNPELSCDFSIAAGLWSPPKGYERSTPLRPGVWSRNGVNCYQPYEPVTESLDAIVALIERELPGWERLLLYNPSHGEHGCGYALLTPPGSAGISTTARNDKLAACAAFLKAKAVTPSAIEGRDR